MNDKKQIEEMILAVYPWLKEVPVEERNQLKENVSGSMVMERLYNAGYRKIDKDSVVLTREEYNELSSIVKTIREQVIQEIRKETAREILMMFDDGNFITEDDLKNAIAKKYGVKIGK